MKNDDKRRAHYAAPTVTDFGKVSVVTTATGMTFLTDSAFTGSMFEEQPGPPS